MEYLIKSTLVLAVFYACYFIFLRKETFFDHNRWFLLGGLVITILFPFVIIPVHVSVEPQAFNSQLINYTEQLPTSVESHTAFDWTNLIMGIYFTGLIIFLIQFLFQFGSLIWLLLTNPKNKDGIYTYVIVTNNVSPFSFFKWIVYNPDAYSDKELALMLTHEKIHASQLHSLDILFTQLVCSIFWFNPLMWLYRKYIRQNLEYIADYRTQSTTNNNKEYQHLLVKTSVAEQKVSLSNNLYNSLIKERIIMLQKSRSNKRKQWKYLLMLPILAGLLMSMNTETVYVPTEDYMNMASTNIEFQDNKRIEIIFTKETTQEQLEEIKKELKSNGIDMTIKNIKLNSDKEITLINIDFKTENGSANYNMSNDKGIKPFYFKTKEDGSFSVGAINEDKFMIVEEIISEENNQNSKPNKRALLLSTDDSEVIFVDSTYSKILIREHEDKVKKFKKLIEHDSIHHLNLDSTHVEIIKEKSDYYFEGNPNTTIIGEKVELINPNKKAVVRINGLTKSNPKPLIILNGELVSDIELETINPENIATVNVLKGDNAVEIYGNKAKNGVIVIRLKDKDFKYLTKPNTWQSRKVKTKIVDVEYDDDDDVEWTEKSKNDQEGPWKITTSVNGYTFISDDDISKNATFGIVTKDTPDSVLEANKASLEDLGISVKYSKLKRNKSGKITSIKITLKNDNGKQSSASYKDDDGIGDIEYGVMGDKLIVRSRN